MITSYADITYMKVAAVLADRSKCQERKVGCVLVYDDKVGMPMIIAEGVNGTKPGLPNDDVNPSHAEQNCLDKIVGIMPLLDFGRCSLYVTCRPCANCTKLLIQKGVGRVFYRDSQPEMSHIEDLKQFCEVHQVNVDG